MDNMVTTYAYHFLKHENRLCHELPDGVNCWYLDWFTEKCHVPDQSGNDTVAEPGNIYIVPPNTPMYFRYYDAASFVHTSIVFDADPDFMKMLALPTMTPIAIRHKTGFEQLLFSMNDCWISFSPVASLQWNSYLLLILTFIHDEINLYDKQYSVKTGDDLRTLRHTIMNSLSTPWTIESMAQRVHMSTRTFQRQYTKLYNKTPIADLYDMRFFKAKRLLEDNYSIQWILQSCCFKSPQHFSRFFKERTGMSPKEYKIEFDKNDPKRGERKSYLTK